MTEALLLHSATDKKTRQIINQPPHALLIIGPAGMGKETLASHIAASLLKTEPGKLLEYPYFYVLSKPKNKQEIPIEAVREVISKLRLKTVIAAKGIVQRVVLIKDANLLSHEAQNALLKALEEPPAGTIFILTSPSDTSVLPTIASRTQKLIINPISQTKAHKFFAGKFDTQSIESAWQLSGGSTGLLTALLNENQEHELKKSVDLAKKFLSSNRYERLLLIDELSSDKQALRNFLEALNRVLKALHHSSIRSSNNDQIKKISVARRIALKAINSLESNVSTRLLCLNLVLQLPV